MSSNESIFIDSYLLGSLSCQPLRCFVPQHDKNDAFVIPTPLSSRRRRDLRSMQKQFQATTIFIDSYLLGSLSCQPRRCFVPSMTKTNRLITIWLPALYRSLIPHWLSAPVYRLFLIRQKFPFCRPY